jgi:hypothetical protein
MSGGKREDIYNELRNTNVATRIALRLIFFCFDQENRKYCLKTEINDIKKITQK